jgi:hypothetical protein
VWHKWRRPTADFDTGQDILRNMIRRAGEILPTDTDTSNADHLIDAKLYIQKAYWDLCALKPWRWARRRKQFVSIGQVTGSVSNISSTTVTLSATVATSMAGRKFLMDSDGIPCRISAHTAGTDTLTLEVAYTGAATSGTYTIFQDEITVASDILAFPTITELHTGDDILVVPENELLQDYPRNVRGSVRTQYATFISDTQVRLCPWTYEPRLFEVTYNRRPSALTFDGVANTDTPVVPQESRAAIAQLALKLLYADKRDGRLQSVQAEFNESLHVMSAKEITFAKPRMFVPRRARI